VSAANRPAIARHLGTGRSTLYIAMDLKHNSRAPRTAKDTTE
jgi:hypothetical protein